MKFVNLTLQENNGVYVIENVINGKKYIGSTFTKDYKGFKKRYNAYTKHSTTFYNQKLTNAIKKYGQENFIFKVLEVVNTTTAECRKKEEYYIALYNTIQDGYNIKACGVGGNGGANKGKKYPKPTEETIKKRAEGVSKAMKGKKKSKEHCLAIRLSRKGSDFWGKKHVFVKDTFLNEIVHYSSRLEASQAIKCSIGQLWCLLTEKTKLLARRYKKCTLTEIDTYVKEKEGVLPPLSEMRF